MVHPSSMHGGGHFAEPVCEKKRSHKPGTKPNTTPDSRSRRCEVRCTTHPPPEGGGRPQEAHTWGNRKDSGLASRHTCLQPSPQREWRLANFEGLDYPINHAHLHGLADLHGFSTDLRRTNNWRMLICITKLVGCQSEEAPTAKNP